MRPRRSGLGSVNSLGGGVCFVIFGAAQPETSGTSEEDYRVLVDGSGIFMLRADGKQLPPVRESSIRGLGEFRAFL